MTTRYNRHYRNWSNSLWRDENEGIVLGVCAGTARAIGVDVAFVRLITVAGLLFALPWTLALYFGAAVFMPDRPRRGNCRR